MKDVMELPKKAWLDLSSTAQPVKPFNRPAARAPEDKPAGNIPSAEKSQIPPTSLAENFMHSIGGDVLIKPDNSDTAAHMSTVYTLACIAVPKTSVVDTPTNVRTYFAPYLIDRMILGILS